MNYLLAVVVLLIAVIVATKLKLLKSAIDWWGIRALRRVQKSEDGARLGAITIASADGYTVWNEPNRAGTPPLHIGDTGERYSTLTGAWWLDDRALVVIHRSGLRMAVFDSADFDRPVGNFEITHLTDDIAAKRIGDGAWEVSVSGCWACITSSYRLQRTANAAQEYTLQSLGQQDHAARDFCHGVAYDDKGQLCYSIHTGKKPRVKIGNVTHRLPAPWGVRDLCHDPLRRRYVAVAVSANPRRTAYEGVITSLWVCAEGSTRWRCIGAYSDIHSDALDVWRDDIWIPDQARNRLIAVDAESGDIRAIFSGDALDFPHGLGISPDGRIAVTNYGTSSVTIVDADSLLSVA